MKIVTIIGTRPQFIKASMVSRAIAKHNEGTSELSSLITEVIVHTGQHYDINMSDIFFKEMHIPAPAYHLGIYGMNHGAMTGRMLEEIEKAFLNECPDLVLTYGDTNSALAGALAAAKLHIPIAHVEAGLRSFNRSMPEEHNRVLIDHCSDILLCPTQTAVDNLKKEGILNCRNSKTRAVLVGDTMYDSILYYLKTALEESCILEKHKLREKEYYLATVHRPYNTDSKDNIWNIIDTFAEMDLPVVFPVHPRTRRLMQKYGCISNVNGHENIIVIDPVGYVDMIMLEKNSKIILTDSGGMQKEAYFLKVPCVTLRPETEWVETVNSGWNVISGLNGEEINRLVQHHKWPSNDPKEVFGDGHASKYIVNELISYN